MTRDQAGAVQIPLPTPKQASGISSRSTISSGPSPQGSMAAPVHPELTRNTQSPPTAQISDLAAVKTGRGSDTETMVPRPAKY